MSRLNYEIAEKYTNFGDFLLNIKKEFAAGGNSIHKARNELKVIRYMDTDLVVKSFKIPNLLNKLIYSYIRDGKAKRSYDNSLKLCSLGIETPEPVGYIEFYEGGLLRESFFVSLMYENDFVIRKALDNKELEGRNELLESFADFTFGVHSKNVYHLDYSAGNILVKNRADGYHFALTDINRMEFRPLSREERLKSFQKLWVDEETLAVLMRRYASLSGWKNEESITKATEYLRSFKKLINAKKRFKSFKRGLKK